MTRKAEVFYQDLRAGILEENDEGFFFRYDHSYLQDKNRAISLTLPLQDEVYHSQILFPFFDGLIPEGWLLNIATSNWKISPRDRMGLLMLLCEDTIGAISIKAMS